MQYDLVFEGGGAKGMVFVGAMQSFEEQGHTIGRLLGTSAGAITACLLAAGYSSAEMAAALSEKENGHSVFVKFAGPPSPFDDTTIQRSGIYELFRKIDIPFVPNSLEQKIELELTRWMASQNTLRHLFSFVERGGWYSADYFVTWLERLLNTGSYRGAPRHFAKMTLAEFYGATQTDVSFVASDTTGGQMLILNHRTAPGLPVAWAVRMSMSIPLLWQEVIWAPAWGPYRGRDVSGHAVVDGGLLSNFPVELLVSRDSSVTEVMGPDVSQHLFGCLIDETLEVPGVPLPPVDPGAFNFGELRTVKRLSNLIDTLLGARDKTVVDALSSFVLRLPAAGYSTTEFEMTDERRNALLQAGREFAKTHLENEAAKATVSFDVGEEADGIHPKARSSATKGALRILGR